MSSILQAKPVQSSTGTSLQRALRTTNLKNGVHHHVCSPFKPLVSEEATMTVSTATPAKPRVNSRAMQLNMSPPVGEPQEPYATVTPESNVEQWTRAISVAIIDVLSGRRRPRSIERWLSPKAFSALCQAVAQRDPRGGALPGWAVSSRVFPQGGGHFEFTATVWDQDRARAVAGHIVAFRGRWLVTDVEV